MTEQPPSKEHVHSWHLGQCTRCLLEQVAQLTREVARLETHIIERQPLKMTPSAYLVEFENGENELHFAEGGPPSVGETVTPLYERATQPPQPDDQLEGACPNCSQWVVLKPDAPSQPPGERTVEEINAQVDERIERVERELDLADVIRELRDHGYHDWASRIERAAKPSAEKGI